MLILDTLAFTFKAFEVSMDILYRLDEFLWSGELEEIVALHAHDHFDSVADEISCYIHMLTFEPTKDPQYVLGRINYLIFGSPPSGSALNDPKSSCEAASALFEESNWSIWTAFLGVLLDEVLDSLDHRLDRSAEISKRLRWWYNSTFLVLLHVKNRPDFVMKVFDTKPASLFSLVIDTFRLAPEVTYLPVRKIVLTIALVHSTISPAPEHWMFAEIDNSAPSAGPGEDIAPADLLHVYPLNHPRLTDFRSFVALAKHMHILRTKYPGRRPAAIKEALGILKNFIENFIDEYPMHPVEVAYLKQDETMLEALEIYAARQRHGKKCFRRSLVPELESARFSQEAVAKSIGLTWKFLKETPGGSPEVQDVGSDVSDFDDDQPVGSGSAQDDLRKILEIYCGESKSKELEDFFRATEPWTALKVDEARGNDLNLAQGTRVSIAGMFGGYLRDVVVLLLRLLLSTCRNAHEYPNTLSTDGDLQFLKRAEISKDRRHLDILAAAVTGLLVQMIHQSSLEGPRTFAAVSNAICSANGCLVLLKFLNGFEDEAFIAGAIPEYVLPALSSKDRKFIAFPLPRFSALIRALSALRLLTQHSPEKIRKFLVAYKSPLILKRLLRIPSFRIQRCAFRLFKSQVRYFQKRVKAGYMKVLSGLFAATTTDPIEDAFLTTACTAGEDEAAVHQGPDSVAGQTEADEFKFEISGETDGDLINGFVDFHAGQIATPWERRTSSCDAMSDQHTEFSSPIIIGAPEVGNFSDQTARELTGILWNNEHEARAYVEATGNADPFFGFADFDDFIANEVCGYSHLFPNLVSL